MGGKQSRIDRIAEAQSQCTTDMRGAQFARGAILTASIDTNCVLEKMNLPQN